jgi:hypothetical protein
MLASPDEPPVTDQPLYWFCILEQALDRGNLDLAAHAVKELKRLGIDITYRRTRRGQEVAHDR